MFLLIVALLIPPLSAKTYITEEKVQIDRCACAWFISRFLDEEPKFIFIKQGQSSPEGITYDFFGADYFHKGPDCSFTAFIKKHIKKKDPALIAVNAVVNDVFAWRSGPNSLSVAIKKHVDQLIEQEWKDDQIYQECMLIFDLLYLKKGGTIENMHASGRKSATAIELRLIEYLYGKNIKDLKSPHPAIQQASNSAALDSKTLLQWLTENASNDSLQYHSLRLLSIRILK